MQPGIVASAERTIVTSDIWSGGNIAEIIGRATDCGAGGIPYTWASDGANPTHTVGIVSGLLARTFGTGQVRRGFSLASSSTLGGVIYAHTQLVSLATAALRLEVRVASITSNNEWYAVRPNIDGTLDLIKNRAAVLTVLDSSTWIAGDDIGILLTSSRVALVKNGAARPDSAYDSGITTSQRVCRLVALANSVFTLGPIIFEIA